MRISVYLPLFLLLLCWRLQDVQLGLVFGGVFFFSVLLHEFGHVIAARMTGGSGEEILVWPFGGLAFVRPAGTFRSQLLTSMAGPMYRIVPTMRRVPSMHTASASWPVSRRSRCPGAPG